MTIYYIFVLNFTQKIFTFDLKQNKSGLKLFSGLILIPSKGNHFTLKLDLCFIK